MKKERRTSPSLYSVESKRSRN